VIIVKCNKVENCFEGDFIINCIFDTAWTKGSIYALKALGQLRYYDSFPKPMFQLISGNGIIVKGVQGLGECKVIYNRKSTDGERVMFMKSFSETIHIY